MTAARVRRSAPAAAVAMVTAALLAIPALAATPDPFMGSPFGQNQELDFRWGSGGTPPTAMKTAIKAAADDANASRRSKAPVFGYVSGAGNAIYYGVSVPCGINGLACFRRDAPDWFGVWLRENGHRFDWGVLSWCEVAGNPNGCYDAENITLDELGHVLGLDHHVNLPDDSDYGDAVVQTYSRTKPKAFYDAHVFGRCDVATLQQVYDVASSSTPYSTCLDVPTELSMTASTTWVLSGSMVTFTASLGSDGTGRLSNNLISGRVVVLQELRTAGWADVLTMKPGSAAGSYSTSLAPRATTTFRARFRKPTEEGLRASSSASVQVGVTARCTWLCPRSGTGSVQ